MSCWSVTTVGGFGIGKMMIAVWTAVSSCGSVFVIAVPVVFIGKVVVWS